MNENEYDDKVDCDEAGDGNGESDCDGDVFWVGEWKDAGMGEIGWSKRSAG